MRRWTWISVLATVTVLAAAGLMSRQVSLSGAAPHGRAPQGTAAAPAFPDLDLAALTARTRDLAARAGAGAQSAWRCALDAAPGLLASADRAAQRVPIPAAIAAVAVGFAMLVVLAARARHPRRAALALLDRGVPGARVARRTRMSRDALRALAKAERR
jgi:hypothetical protein